MNHQESKPPRLPVIKLQNAAHPEARRMFVLVLLICLAPIVTYVPPANAQNTLGTLTQGQPVTADGTGGTGQTASSSAVFLDTTKLTGTTIAGRISTCLSTLASTGGVCDARAEAAANLGASITWSQSNITLILPMVTITEATNQSIAISGSNNSVVCPALWACTLDGSSNGSANTISVSGSGNRLAYFAVTGGRLNGGTGSEVVISNTGAISNDIVEYLHVVNASDTAIQINDCTGCVAFRNRVDQAYGVGIQVDASNVSSLDNKVVENQVYDAEISEGPNGAGNGDINIISPGGQNLLLGTLVKGNDVRNGLAATAICSGNTPATSDTGCSEGIQVTSKVGQTIITENTVYKTGSEGITCGNLSCSVIANHVGNAGMNCVGCGGILESIQTNQTNATVGPAVISNNVIWNDATGCETTNCSNNSTGVSTYGIWIHVAGTASGTLLMEDLNVTGNTVSGTGGTFTSGLYYINSSTTSVTLRNVSWSDNVIDPTTVTAPLNITYGTNTTGAIALFNNRVYSSDSTPVLNDLASYDSNGNVIDSGVPKSVASAMLNAFCITTVGTSLSIYVLAPSATGTGNCNTTSATEVPMAYACTAKNLYVTAATGSAIGTGGTVTLYKNTGAQSLKCLLGLSTSCHDTSDTVSFSAGDTWSVRVAAGQASDTISNVRASFQCQ